MDLPGGNTRIIIHPLIQWRVQKLKLHRMCRHSVYSLNFLDRVDMPQAPGEREHIISVHGVIKMLTLGRSSVGVLPTKKWSHPAPTALIWRGGGINELRHAPPPQNERLWPMVYQGRYLGENRSKRLKILTHEREGKIYQGLTPWKEKFYGIDIDVLGGNTWR